MCHHQDGEIIVPRLTEDTWQQLCHGQHRDAGCWSHGPNRLWLVLESADDSPEWAVRVQPPGEDPEDGPSPYPMPPAHWHRIGGGDPDFGENRIIRPDSHKAFQIIAVKIGDQRWAHCQEIG